MPAQLRLAPPSTFWSGRIDGASRSSQASNNGADCRAAATRELAASIGAVVVHKGPTTIVAYPDGPALVVANGGPALATAGTGDVLAGAVTALLAQGVDPVRAAASEAWLRAEAGCEQVGLVARGLPDRLGLLLTDG